MFAPGAMHSSGRRSNECRQPARMTDASNEKPLMARELLA
jgi:hypothetical protein